MGNLVLILSLIHAKINGFRKKKTVFSKIMRVGGKAV